MVRILYVFAFGSSFTTHAFTSQYSAAQTRQRTLGSTTLYVRTIARQDSSSPSVRRKQPTGLGVLQQSNEFTEQRTTQSLSTSTSLEGTNGDSNVEGLISIPETATASTSSSTLLLSEDHLYELAIRRTVGWVAAAILFGAGLGLVSGPETSEEFFAGYLLEQSLSIDNLLVFLLLFEYFKVPLAYQNRVLNWGIIGAIVMRAIMIGLGAVAIHQFRVVLLGFAGILIFSSAKVFIGDDGGDDEEDLGENQIVRFSNNLISSTPKFDGDRFFTVIDGVRMATPMLLCLFAVEISDVVFAVDSIPAVFGVTEVRTLPSVVVSSRMLRPPIVDVRTTT
jgi:predicted tellurium resistance membrane protein TerC